MSFAFSCYFFQLKKTMFRFLWGDFYIYKTGYNSIKIDSQYLAPNLCRPNGFKQQFLTSTAWLMIAAKRKRQHGHAKEADGLYIFLRDKGR